MTDIERHPGPFTGPDAELARAIAMAVIPWYGNDDATTHQRIMQNGIWNDHIAVQAALATIHHLRPRIEQLEAALDDKDEALHKIERWSRAYPLDIDRQRRPRTGAGQMNDLPQRLRLNATIPLVMQAADRIEALEAALRWALPLADIALEQCRCDRMRAGHEMTFERGGAKWVGLYQSEWDQREAARAALDQKAST